MAFKATFQNISVILTRSILLMAETGVPWENHRPAVIYWQTVSHNIASSAPRMSGIRTPWGKRKGYSRIENREIQTTLGIRHNTKTNKTKHTT